MDIFELKERKTYGDKYSKLSKNFNKLKSQT